VAVIATVILAMPVVPAAVMFLMLPASIPLFYAFAL
jgi:hypothetical protein